MPASGRKRLNSTRFVGLSDLSANARRSIDLKIDWIAKTVKEMRDEGACKKEIKLMIREIVKEEFNNLKQELELLKRV